MTEQNRPEIPARFRAYNQVVDLYHANLAKGIEWANNAGIKVKIPDDADYIPYFEYDHIDPLDLPTLGSNDASISSMRTYTPGLPEKAHGPVIGVELRLYKDGDPFIVPGDPEDPDGVPMRSDDWGLHTTYTVLFAAEMPPAVVLTHQLREANKDGGDWQELLKRPIDDHECEEIIKYLDKYADVDYAELVSNYPAPQTEVGS